MDQLNKEDHLSPDESSPGPPTLAQSTLDFGCVLLGSKMTLQQTIANTTRKPMIWLADTRESRWLTIEPDHGVLQPGERQSIRVTADTSFLDVGEHSVTLTFSAEGDYISMSEDTTGKITVDELHKPRAPRGLEAGLDFGGLTPHSTRRSGLLIKNPLNRTIKWQIQIGGEKLGMGVRETLEHSTRPAGIKENFSITKEHGIILSETEGQLQPRGSHTVYVTINSANLEAGYAYTTNLTLISHAAGTSPRSVLVPLTFNVSIIPYNDGGPRVPTDLPPNINLTIQQNQPQGTYPLSFTNPNFKAVRWVLAPDPGATWLVPTPSSGTLAPNGQPLDQANVTLTARRGSLSAGTYRTNLNLNLSWDDGSPGSTALDPPIPVVSTVS